MNLKTIVVAIDFSEASAHALDLARMLADACGASLRLLHVIGYPLATAMTVEQERRDACVRLRSLLDDEDRIKRHATVTCIVGTPPHEIVQYALDNAVDLIVMGTHEHGPTWHEATGSIADMVLGSAPCAVLAVKPPSSPHPARFDASVTTAHA